MTYNPQLIIDGLKLLLVPHVRPAAHKNLVPPFNPTLRRRLPEVDFLSFMPASVCVEKDSDGRWIRQKAGQVGTKL